MENIYSELDKDVLLAITTTFSDFNSPRNEVVPASEFIQGGMIRVNEGDRFRPHKHIWKQFNSQYGYNETKAQECWIVIRGLIEAVIYDSDDTIVKKVKLSEGSAIFLLHGGHTFSVLENNSCIWELKTGPYEGQANDKEFINEG